jgi:small-conductance mechanosensitive channel
MTPRAVSALNTHHGVDMEGILERSIGTILANSLISLVFLVAVVGLRMLVLRHVLHREEMTPEARRRWIVNSRNTVLMVLVVGLVFIWANELFTLAVSLVAIAAALVIATKELILCFSGAVLRAGSKAFSLGDLIEIGGIRGDVVDINVFAATLREVGPGKGSHQYTGRAVTIPNSLLLNSPLINHSYMGDYLVHIITVPWNLDNEWAQAEKLLLEAAVAECSPLLEEAQVHMKRLASQQGLEPISVEPRVSVEMPEPNRIHFLLRIPAPARRQSRLEQAILRRFLSEWARYKTPAPDAS